MANVLSFACREVTWFRVRSVHSSHFNTIRCGLDLLWLVGKSEEYRRHQHKTRFLQREPFVFFLRFFLPPPLTLHKKNAGLDVLFGCIFCSCRLFEVFLFFVFCIVITTSCVIVQMHQSASVDEYSACILCHITTSDWKPKLLHFNDGKAKEI